MSGWSAEDMPELVPHLKRGKHRSPRKGACFMELASYLAGERWSDRPSCTHPLLAEVARLVNDLSSDTARPALARLIPKVIGVTSADARMDARIALRCAQAALPVAAATRQPALASAVLTGERVLAALEGRPAGRLSASSRWALEQVPLVAAEAERRRPSDIPVSQYQRRAAPATVRCAVRGIAEACVPDADHRLYRLLSDVIEDCAPWRDPQTAQVDAESGAAACRLSGTV
jgi:hypothetical protein